MLLVVGAVVVEVEVVGAVVVLVGPSVEAADIVLEIGLTVLDHSLEASVGPA